nr:hypothetical protein [Corynebacterium glutamicum]
MLKQWTAQFMIGGVGCVFGAYTRTASVIDSNTTFVGLPSYSPSTWKR